MKIQRNVIVYILIILTVIAGALVILSPPKANGIDFTKPLEKQIQGTPAWVQNGTVIAYGEFPPALNTSVNYLINNKIYFIYDSECIHCEHQIASWNATEWEQYKSSGYAIQTYIFPDEANYGK